MKIISRKGGTCVTAESCPHTWRLNHTRSLWRRLSAPQVPPTWKLSLAAALVTIFALASVVRAQTEKRAQPNIVVILADDMGFCDVGCYGSEIATPHLDSLAAGGLRFTQFYNMARCCPTRASLLTGLYPHQAGIGHMMTDQKLAGYQGDLNRQAVTIAQVLKPAGYMSYAVGKWHVTPKTKPVDESEKYNWPMQRGFDRFYGTIHGAGSYWDPSSLVRDNKVITAFNDAEYRPREEYYYTDAISDHAVRFIEEHGERAAGKPLFLYVAFTAAHWPMHARERDIAKYSGRYNDGYEAIRAARFAREKELGLIDKEAVLTKAAANWDDVKDKAFETRCMEVYAAMIDSMDQGIGRIIAALKQKAQFENTLILYLQDNGGCAEKMGRGGAAQARPVEPTLPTMSIDDLQHGSTPKQTRDGFPVRQGYGVLPGGRDTYIAYGEGWANVSNTPFREYKHWVHEGGIATPLIVHWPAAIEPARRNTLVHAPAHLIDIMATCVDLAGARYPAEYRNEKITPLAGTSLRALFGGKSFERKEPIFFEHEGNRALRDGKWKLVAKGPRGKWELYDMEKDRSELHDLVIAQPAKARELIEKWEAWAKRAYVLPWPWKENAELDGAQPPPQPAAAADSPKS